MRYPNAIEIYVNIDLLTEQTITYLKENFDFELNAKNGKYTLWIHDDGNFPFERELFQYLPALIGVYNNRTKQDHLDLFIEASAIDEFGIETIEGVKFKNIRASELQYIDLSKILLKRELYEKGNNYKNTNNEK